MLTRGSTWSRWDLHIHTPYSIVNDYGGDGEEIWEKFISNLEELPRDVEVIGINDYYFIDGFEKVMDYKMNKGRLQNIKKIFPIIEFRIDTFATANESKLQKINLHVLFKIDESKWKEEINKIKTEFIQHINISSIHDTKSLSKQSFIDVGGDLQEGFSSFVPPTEQIYKLIESNTWSDKVIVFLGYKEWNNLEKGGQLRPYKRMFLDKADALFTASPNNDVSKKESILSEFGGSVLVHSQDIHNFTDLHQDNYCCYTWIKADRTFEGLKQILYEPKERIIIQKNNPFYDEQKSAVIESLRIDDSNNWFIDSEIPLNSGLISIIGEKGSGKTALLDLMAIANGEGIYEPDNMTYYSFYNRARQEIKDTEIHIGYLGSDNKSVHKINGMVAESETNNYAKVRYLSLKELESYVDQKDKFQLFIKDIIHTKSPDLNMFEKKVNKQVNQIQEVNLEISKLEREITTLNLLEVAYENKKSELELHKKNEPKIKTNFSEKQEREYKSLITSEQEINSQINRNNLSKDQINELDSWIKEEVSAFKEKFTNNYKVKLNQLNNIDTSIFKDLGIHITIEEQNKIAEEIKRLDNQNEEFHRKLEEVKEKIKPLEEINKSLISEQKNTRAWIEKKSQLEEELNQLKQKKETLDSHKKQITELQKQRKAHYTKLLETKTIQKEKYKELKSDMESNQNISFNVKIEFNSNKFLEKENAIINHGSGNSQEVIIENLQEKIIDNAKEVDNVTKEEVTNIVSFVDSIDEDNFIGEVFGEKKNKDNLLKKSFNVEDLYNWIFDDYFDVNYFIEFKGRPLETLSPGQCNCQVKLNTFRSLILNSFIIKYCASMF